MIDKIKEILREKKLLKGVRKVIIGYSGGPDSTFLREVLSGFYLEIILAYFNHNLRDDSGKEEEFVMDEAKRTGFKLRIGKGDVKRYCDNSSLSIEEGARLLRLNYLRDIKREEGGDVIVLGHNLDDQIENFFIRLFRKSGFGLSSMNYLKGDILRPLLDIRKNDIIQYLKRHNIPFYTDPSNENLSYLRNRIRKRLVPVLENIHENSIEGIKRSIINIRDMEIILEKQIEDIPIRKYRNYVEVDRDKFDELYTSLKFLLIRKMLSFFGLEMNLKRLHIANLPEKGIIELRDAYIENLPDKVIIVRKINEQEKELSLSGEECYGNFHLETKEVKFPVSFKKEGCEFFDLDKLELPLKVRSREKGDRVVLFGSKRNKKLNEIFINKKIPRSLRDTWPIIYDNCGIILIPGVKRSYRAPMRDKTKRILQIKYREVMDGQ
ncbi:MAG: tRNA lysidine(34) synthetase TilS [candidate division WOR-3 bacterium]|nr:tRNA lysidine(34) synthetase TilS [candidate division WOR-3 bacterium]